MNRAPVEAAVALGGVGKGREIGDDFTGIKLDEGTTTTTRVTGNCTCMPQTQLQYIQVSTCGSPNAETV
jgi:hypothetical protein